MLKSLKVICGHGIAAFSKSLSESWHDFVITVSSKVRCESLVSWEDFVLKSP